MIPKNLCPFCEHHIDTERNNICPFCKVELREVVNTTEVREILTILNIKESTEEMRKAIDKLIEGIRAEEYEKAVENSDSGDSNYEALMDTYGD
jgi:reverse gyrase